MSIVKSGFLHRQSTILRRWKRNWFDLWSDGRLVFYDDQHRRDMEDEIHMRVDCINIRSATACQDLNPPEGRSRDALLQIVCRDGQVISICGDSADDALAWTMALQDARISSVVAPPQIGFAQQIVASAPPPYAEYGPPPPVYVPDAYGGYSPAPPVYGTQIIYSADGQPYAVAYPYQYQGAYPMRNPQEMNQVIVHERQRDDGGDVALSMLAGAATGLALGSLFSVF
ncbi:pleckstrin homology domain-containing family B member 2 [Salmo salar]|uniref:Pleckstrin homology domain-containing family B member 2 n=2 Tax=Salmo TaxID=8028 RepID=B5X0R2_SALSA|nr:pleckstrin homology domain-containing family B member 2 [Salmo salar]XP_029607007.1 pleckstrin homology domain-containing family B member 2-like [Salmo trutta]ACI32893.1 Pleckstrin homology domain-containing family B member 2 [Salmo salar]|eukprot:NP_001135180.1 Pleckstrin homology domain-containing family B member 2 [Salmo salar]